MFAAEVTVMFALTVPFALGPATPLQPTQQQPGTEARPRQIVISVGTTIRLQMSSKRPITRVDIDREGIVRVRAVTDDHTSIFITGIAPGRTRIVLTDDGGKTEVHEWGKPANSR